MMLLKHIFSWDTIWKIDLWSIYDQELRLNLNQEIILLDKFHMCFARAMCVV